MAWRLQFDGVDDYARIPNSAGDALKESFTLVGCIWVPDWSATPGPTLISNGSGSSGGRNYGIVIRAVNDGIAVLRNTGTTTNYWRGIFHDLASIEGWVWVSVTYNRLTGGLVGYIGDEAIGSAITSTGTVAFLNPRGYDVGVYSTHFSKFQLRHWSLWKGVCTQSEIAEIINKRYDQVSVPPAAIYEIDTGTGSVLVDSSGNDYHGTIHGATWVWVDEPGQGQKVTGSITFRGRSSMSLSAVKRAIGSITFRGSSSMFLSAVKTAVGKITFRGGSFMSLIGLVLRELEGVYQISSSEIISRNQPVLSTDLANYIEVWINPRVPADQAEEVYRSKEPEPISPGESKTFNLKLDKEPVIEAVASLEDAGANLAITDTKFYSGSAEITVKNSGATEQACTIVIQAKPLELQGRRKIVVKDEESILDHGLVKYTFDSPLVQDEASARDIGKKILWLFSVARANIEIEWRGDPALELADPVQIPEFEKLGVSRKENFYVVRQLLEVVGGGLDATLSGRKIPRLKEGD